MKILVIGGYGNFGKRLVKSLCEHHNHDLIIAGRSLQKAQDTQEQLKRQYQCSVQAIRIDVLNDDLITAFEALKPNIVVNASGPFQAQRDHKSAYSVARACIQTSCHYIDLADDREFVTGIASLDREAKQRKLMVISGASTVPGLTSAVIEEYLPTFSVLDTVNFGISPGNKTERGRGTVASILSYTGRPFFDLKEGEKHRIFGWQNLKRYDFGNPLGKRWMSNCDIPDLTLLPKQYPKLRNVHFQAGLEVSLLHLGLWFLSVFSRIGIIRNWARYSKWITAMSEWFIHLGSDAGGMFVELYGKDYENNSKKVTWQLIAENNVGPNIPTISAELIIHNIASNKIIPGAKPCMGLFSLGEFMNIAGRWNIYQREL